MGRNLGNHVIERVQGMRSGRIGVDTDKLDPMRNKLLGDFARVFVASSNEWAMVAREEYDQDVSVCEG